LEREIQRINQATLCDLLGLFSGEVYNALPEQENENLSILKVLFAEEKRLKSLWSSAFLSKCGDENHSLCVVGCVQHLTPGNHKSTAASSRYNAHTIHRESCAPTKY